MKLEIGIKTLNQKPFVFKKPPKNWRNNGSSTPSNHVMTRVIYSSKRHLDINARSDGTAPRSHRPSTRRHVSPVTWNDTLTLIQDLTKRRNDHDSQLRDDTCHPLLERRPLIEWNLRFPKIREVTKKPPRPLQYLVHRHFITTIRSRGHLIRTQINPQRRPTRHGRQVLRHLDDRIKTPSCIQLQTRISSAPALLPLWKSQKSNLKARIKDQHGYKSGPDSYKSGH